ncbi:MAG: HNH endonuclease [Nitrososphaerota archaeon]|nr:HNH endonuclease [Nitrososphaerota archaeon]
MKLIVELVPSTVWYSSLYRLLPSEVWSKLREGIIAENGRRCQICGATLGKMNLHECWNYDDQNYIQKLVGFNLLCTMCHHVKHIGFARILSDQGKLDYADVMAHFCKVNGCSEAVFTKHVDEAFVIWHKRSQYQWSQDFGEYNICFKK